MTERHQSGVYEFDNSPPSPQQLFHLQAKLAQTAREQDRLMASTVRDRSYFLLVKPIESLYVDESRGLPDGVEEQIKAVIRRADPTSDQWRLYEMVLIATMWHINPSGSKEAGVSSRYDFRWSVDQVHDAVRTVRQRPQEDPATIEDIAFDFSFPEAAADTLFADEQMNHVTGGDVSLLTDDVSEFCRRSLLIGVDNRDRRTW